MHTATSVDVEMRENMMGFSKKQLELKLGDHKMYEKMINHIQ